MTRWSLHKITKNIAGTHIFKGGQDVSIGTDELTKATQTLQDYKKGKTNLEKRIVANNEWYKMRHYKQIEGAGQTDDTASAWLFNSIANKHADAMDNLPECVICPREPSDKQAADILSEVVPVILDRNEFVQTYSAGWWDKLNTGTACYGVFWDDTKNYGQGDIAVRNIDVLNLFWEPGIKDIQKSKNIFHIELHNNDDLEAQYPSLKGHLGAGGIEISKYIYDDTVDTSNKSPIVDWYYKVRENNKVILHYCKFCNDVLLYSSEDDSAYSSGWYTHGNYPFVLDPLFDDKGTPCGFGYIDIMRDAQKQIDILNDNLIKYSKIATTPRYFISATGNINEEEFANLDNAFIHINGMSQIGDNIKPVDIPALPAIYEAILNNKINELKETSGNRDFSQGSTASGVTAASAIAALQEAGSKLSRDMIKGSYNAYKKIINISIELIRQFYTHQRTFRIIGNDGSVQFKVFDNSLIKPQNEGDVFGVALGDRTPIFDIDVKVQKSSPYNRQAINNLAIQLYQLGMFQPQNASVALAALSIMEFDGKDALIETIKQNGTLYDQLMQARSTGEKMAQIIDAEHGTNISEQMSSEQLLPKQRVKTIPEEKDDIITKAKLRAAERTQPR